jgi:four helix bundle protein
VSQLPTTNCQDRQLPTAEIQLPITGRRGAPARRFQFCLLMDHTDWTFKDPPYDLRERLLLFACVIVKLVQYLHSRGPVAASLSDQLLRAATSAGANYEEADDGSSPRDKRAKRMIVLRELKETRFRLRVLRKTDLLTSAHDPILKEATELKNIVAAIIRNSRTEDN